MVKLFVGNLGDTNTVTSNDLREQFERYGSVTECERVKNYAFVHMDDRNAAEKALQELNGTSIKGTFMRVELSDRQQPRKASIKLFVGNLSDGTTKEELRELFEKHTDVLEADVVKNFGFVHIDAEEGKNKVQLIIRELNEYNLNGNLIRVQQSTSTVRQRPGMQGDLCYRYLPQSNPIVIPQQNTRSAIPTSRFLPSSHDTISELSGTGSFGESYGRFSSVNENEGTQLNLNGMCYENFSNNTENRPQFSSYNLGSDMSYQASRLTEAYGPSFPRHSMY